MTTVYLADLRHNYSGVLAVECMPLGIGYMKAVMDRDLPEASSRLFAYPDRLLAAMEAEPPHVLMLSNYMWNEWLSFHFAKLAKRLRPETLVVMGGPNVPLEPERQLAYLAAHPEVDVYVLGEGDFLAREVVRHFAEAGHSLARFAAREVPSCIVRRPDGTLVRTEMWERARDLDDIPSPWLTGVLDEFFDGRLAPLLETNRGCPFQCTFCVQGVRWYTKVQHFPLERIRAEVDYVAARVHAQCPSMTMLRIADSNYAMFERDVEISSYLGEAQAKWGYPTYIEATTGKNRPERVIQSLEKVNGAIVVYSAVQSLDEQTLKNVKRSNISTEAYEQVMIEVRGRGLRSLSDLILALPGETVASHLGAINKLLDAGTHEMHLFQALMLKGSELETEASRRRYRFETRFRVLPKNWGVYGGEQVFETDEIVVATDTLSFADYLECRKYALAFSVFWNNSWFEDAATFAASFGVVPSEWVRAVREAMERDDGAVGAFVRDFVAETEGELFPSREACVAYYQREENWQRLLAGEVGESLLYKYRAMAGFWLWPAMCRLAMDVTRTLVVARGAGGVIADFDALWEDVTRYVLHKHTHGTSEAEVLAPGRARLRHDVEGWIAAGMPRNVEPFRLPVEREFVFELTDEGARELRGVLAVWSMSLRGLTKGVTRMRTTSLVRRCRPALAAPQYEPTAVASWVPPAQGAGCGSAGCELTR